LLPSLKILTHLRDLRQLLLLLELLWASLKKSLIRYLFLLLTYLHLLNIWLVCINLRLLLILIWQEIFILFEWFWLHIW
jgi:hypothetical protein